MLIAAAGGSSLNGGDDGDELVGGPGGDSFVGGAGDDSISSRDALSEQVSCGAGTDTAVADNLGGLAGCEQIDRGEDSAKPGDVADPDADVVAPALSRLTLGRRAVRFSLSEGATVTLRLVRAEGGRWVRTRRSLTFGCHGRPEQSRAAWTARPSDARGWPLPAHGACHRRRRQSLRAPASGLPSHPAVSLRPGGASQ